MSPWLSLRHTLLPPAENMAWDEALLEAAARLGRPVLRFYGWAGPAATFGYFQKIAEVERLTALRPLLRRPTGGGLVPHDADWTYSAVLPPDAPWYSLRAIESYRRMHEWIRTAFAEIEVATELSPCARKGAPGQCFVGAEQFDVLLDGRKFAGAAQRRTKDGLLIQGSIQPPAGMDRLRFESAMLEVAIRTEGTTWTELNPDAVLLGRVRDLAESKYSRAEFNRRR
jgi:lipoyl(octanoyl) transferase